MQVGVASLPCTVRRNTNSGIDFHTCHYLRKCIQCALQYTVFADLVS